LKLGADWGHISERPGRKRTLTVAGNYRVTNCVIFLSHRSWSVVQHAI